MGRLLGFCLLAAGFTTSGLAQVEDPAARICLTLLAADMHDTNSVFSEQYHFTQFQSVLKSAHFSTYQDYASSAQALGMNVPLPDADAMIGFRGDYKTNAGTFRQQLDQFLSTTYDQAMTHTVFAENTTRLNAAYLQVVDNCQRDYFDKDRLKLTVEATPSDYGNFVIAINGYVPQALQTQFRIDDLEPRAFARCEQNGKALSFPLSVPTGQALLSCKKDPKKPIYFQIASNLGNSTPLLLPARPAKRKDGDATTPALAVAPPNCSNWDGRLCHGCEFVVTSRPIPIQWINDYTCSFMSPNAVVEATFQGVVRVVEPAGARPQYATTQIGLASASGAVQTATPCYGAECEARPPARESWPRLEVSAADRVDATGKSGWSVGIRRCNNGSGDPASRCAPDADARLLVREKP